MMKMASWRHGGDKHSAAAAAAATADACVCFRGKAGECLERRFPCREITGRFIYLNILYHTHHIHGTLELRVSPLSHIFCSVRKWMTRFLTPFQCVSEFNE